MHCTLLRNATLRLEYAGRTILVDPFLAEAGSMDPFAGGPRNPTAPLPVSPAEAVAGIDAFIVSHEHPDHWDPAAAAAIPKDTPAFCQPGVEGRLALDGFTNVTPIEEHHAWDGLRLTRTGGHHGRGEIETAMGPVSGFVFAADDEPTVYWAGDTVWCDEVDEAIAVHDPDVVITHSGGATIPGHDPIIMGVSDTLRVIEAAPGATVIAVHLESLDHCPVTRGELREAAKKAGVAPGRLLIPFDGELVAVEAE
jgi:L-ascorbate metabolism protein UlaG (beta-lactamase superfamily)